ncbi:MAG: glycosyltransferase [Actinobacteria bacterium]|nr:glycosyltransferase [Actinomycetota bacterium]
MTTISAVVPATNQPRTLDGCRSALLASDSPPEEIVVVVEPADANAARARNLGAHRAAGDVLLFVDSDVEVRRDAVSRIRAAFASDPTLVALFGSYDDAPADPGAVAGFRNLLHHHVHQSSPGPATTFWTGLGAVRRDAFFSVGGFDESVPFMEDIDLGMRLTATGARIELDPQVQGTHLKSWSVWGMVRMDLVDRGIPWVLLLLRHRGATNVLNLGWRHRLSALTVLLGALALGRRRPSAGLTAGLGLVALNRPFYSLLLRRRGPVQAMAGVFLHALHHLASIAAVPIGIWLHLRDRTRRDRRP